MAADASGTAAVEPVEPPGPELSAAEPESEDLLALARTVLAHAPRQVGADRTLAAALLVRQALEVALDDWWGEVLPAMAATRDRAQQITLPFYVDADLAGDITWAWARLSATCHHHAYALPPTVAEIEALIDVVDRLTEALPVGILT